MNLVQSIPDNGAHKTLGYKMSPLNGPDSHLKHWREKESKFFQILLNNPLTSYEVKILYKNIYIPTMRYIMPFTCLKDEVIQKNSTKLFQMFLNKMGYANSTS